ncbi:hypothetical protein [Haloferax volcanii]|uniref:hypothetical protein n=1 Tax=Haloferax volcanii TaxID=2246 RepID=UPI003D303210
MTTPDGDLPVEIKSRIDPGSYDMELTQRHVALEFVHGDRPFYSVAQMHAALGSDVSSDTVRSRMDELEEREVLKSEQVNNGSVYWLIGDTSEWPIPPDVGVEPKQEEMTISEWRHQLHVQIAAISILTAIIGTAITLTGTFQAGGYYQLPISTDELLAYGLTAGLFSYFGLFFAGLVWILDLPGIDEIRSMWPTQD